MLLDAEREAARPYGWSSRPPDAPTGGWQLHTRTLHSTGTSMLGGGDAHGAFDLRPASQQGLNPRRLPATKFPGVYVPQPPSAVPTAAENGGLATGSLRHKLPWERPITPAMAAGGSAGLTPRRPAPPPSYARPSTRAEAISLSERLRATLCEGGNRESVDAAWHGVFCELVRQVYVHCNERGQLLDAVRVYLEGELKMARATLAEQQRELNRLRKDASVLMGTGDKRGAGDKSHEAAAAAAREQIERRVEMIFDAGGRLPSEGKASLVGRLVGACEPEERGSLVEAALAATPHAERLTSLNTELDRLVVADLMAVLSQARLFAWRGCSPRRPPARRIPSARPPRARPRPPLSAPALARPSSGAGEHHSGAPRAADDAAGRATQRHRARGAGARARADARHEGTRLAREARAARCDAHASRPPRPPLLRPHPPSSALLRHRRRSNAARPSSQVSRNSTASRRSPSCCAR